MVSGVIDLVDTVDWNVEAQTGQVEVEAGRVACDSDQGSDHPTTHG